MKIPPCTLTEHLFYISEHSQFLVRQHLVASHIHSMWHNQTTEGWHGACMKSYQSASITLYNKYLGMNTHSFLLPLKEDFHDWFYKLSPLKVVKFSFRSYTSTRS